MTGLTLVDFAVPDRFEIDGSLVARSVEERDVPLIAPAFSDEEDFGPALAEQIPALRANGVLFPYVIEDTTDGSLLGGVTLRHFDPMRGVIEIGYWLFAEARGRGLATRAVRAVAREAFASGISRLEANVRIGNDSSERVLERAGFTREGVRRRLLGRGSDRADATLFSLLPNE